MLFRPPAIRRHSLNSLIFLAAFSVAIGAHAQWVAYNDHRPSGLTSPNATGYDMIFDAAPMPLKDFGSGAFVSAELSVTQTGTPDDFGGNNYPNPDTPAYNLFNAIVDVGNAGIPGIRNSSGTSITLTFANLNPGNFYKFRGASVRGNNYADRWTFFTIEGADSFLDAHVDASANNNLITISEFPTATLGPGQVALNSGENRDGSLVGWDEIIPGADGTFSIRAEQYMGPTPFGNTANASTVYGYGFTAIYLEEVIGTTTPIAITNQPQSITLGERDRATFTVGASGAPIGYYWYRDGALIPGANQSSYSIPLAAYPVDNGARFHVVLSNALSLVTSATATLTVLPDTNAPTIVSAIGELDLTQVRVTFSEPIPDTGPDGYVGNFIVFPTGGDPNGAEALLTLAAALSPNGQTVTLTTDPRMAGVNYSLRIIAVFDASSQQNPFPDTILPFIQHVIVPLPADGSHEFHYYEQGNLDGTGWQTPGFDDTVWLTGMNVLTQTGGEGIHAAFGGTVGSPVLTPQSGGGPNTVYFRTHFNLPASPGNAAVRLTNVIDDGAVFYVNGMDVGRVRMAPGAVTFDQQANANPGEPVAPDGFIIPTSALIAGDNLLAIEVHQNGTASSDIVMGVRVETIIAAFSTGQPSIITPPQSQTVNEGGSVTFNVAADGAVPLFYQWRKGGVDIAGANNASYTINPALPGSAGNYSVFVSNSLGTANSTVATLTVTTDTTPPAFLSAVADTNLTNINLVFSERLDTANAQDVSHYNVQLTAGGGALTIESAVLVNGTSVILTTSPRTQGENYTIVLNGVTDTAVARNPATPTTRAVRASIVILAPDDTTLWHFDTASNILDGLGWQLPGYNDGAWLTGLAGFTTPGDEFTTNGFELRTTNMIAASLGGPPTAYYRVAFNFPGSTANAALHIVGVIDDGLVAYINGVEAGRLRITNTSPVSFTNLATVSSPETANVHLPLETVTLTNLSGLISGPNLLALELHQNATTSSDAVLSIQLVAEIEQFGDGGGVGARLNVSRDPTTGQVTISWSGSGTLQQATTLPSGGTGWMDVPGNPPSPYTFTLTGTQGFFRLR